MICDGKGNVLVEDRRKADWPGVTFPGGHVEPGESFTSSVVREVKEETGLDIKNPTLCGVKQFQTSEDERYVVLFYKASEFSGSLRSSEEGEIFWVPRAELSRYALSVDFERMLAIFEREDLNEFYYYKENGAWQSILL